MFSSFKTSFPREEELMDSEQRLELRQSLDLYRRTNEEDKVVECAVMATGFERRQLLRMLEERGVAWEKHLMHDIHEGVIKRIGGTKQRPVALDIRFCKINWRLVGFFDPSSRFVDYDLVNQWIQDAVLPVADGRTRFSETADGLIGLLIGLEIIPRLTR